MEGDEEGGSGGFGWCVWLVVYGKKSRTIVVVIMGLYLIHPSTNQEKLAYSK